MLMQPYLEITTVSKCPVNCRFCPQDVFQKAYKGQAKLTFEDFKTVLDKLPKGMMVCFSGYAEPFLNADAIKMMQYAEETSHPIMLFSTLVGLNMQKARELAEIEIEYFCLHLPDNLGNAKISDTQEYREVLNYVLRHMTISNFSVHNMLFQSDGRAGNLTDARPYIYGPFNCVKLVTPQFVMLPNCDVQLCCMDFGLQHKIGNLKTQSWDELVNSPVYKKLREDRFEIGSPGICRRCAYATPIKF